ncbi:hypothetical protein OIE52_36430 [Streptomyces canus]|uniref:DUF3558 domain-containing protein n=1 Tax=Streptomyces doebereineriae TaxID=3075528 RepID=A0ABU2V6Q2_9ACTN|nr:MULTISPECIES: hypothetical protein [Streptomyces]MCX4856496.1 hypothetical protein [Streptomyces canus]MDT0481124.1 hypothetical protein [Streptomyces sp. DSM 41640]WSW38041.1 hypothetical protein OG426_39135 [Streptomyces canus]
MLERSSRSTRYLVAFAVTLMAAAGCSNSDKQTNDESKPVCGGKLAGDAFQTLAGDGGITEEQLRKFSPKEWTAAGSCTLYGKEHAVEIDYLWHSDSIDNLDRYRSPGPSTVKTFKVGSSTGYLERTKVRVAKGNVNQNRAWLALPCAMPGEATSDHAVLEIEVKEPPPARSLDDSLTKAFVSALTIATSYLGDDVFKCSASPSPAASRSASPNASGG